VLTQFFSELKISAKFGNAVPPYLAKQLAEVVSGASKKHRYSLVGM